MIKPGGITAFLFIMIAVFIIMPPEAALSQVKHKNPVLKWSTWIVLQAIPTISFFDDNDGNNSRALFGLEWQVIPYSYSFSSNKYISPSSFFFINPTKRFSGSVELFAEPDYVTGTFKYASLKKFMYKTGGRVILPAAQRGEYLAFSLGAGYYNQKTSEGVLKDGVTYEAGVYTMYGMLGLKFNYNQNAISRYSIGLYIKYY